MGCGSSKAPAAQGDPAEGRQPSLAPARPNVDTEAAKAAAAAERRAAEDAAIVNYSAALSASMTSIAIGVSAYAAECEAGRLAEQRASKPGWVDQAAKAGLKMLTRR